MVLSTYFEDSHPDGQEIPLLLWNPRVNYCIRKKLPFVRILSQTSPLRFVQSYLFEISSNIILGSTPRFPKWPPFFMLSCQNFVQISRLSHQCYMARPYSKHWFRYLNNIYWRVQFSKLLLNCCKRERSSLNTQVLTLQLEHSRFYTSVWCL